jgi:hypothetical protein
MLMLGLYGAILLFLLMRSCNGASLTRDTILYCHVFGSVRDLWTGV